MSETIVDRAGGVGTSSGRPDGAGAASTFAWAAGWIAIVALAWWLSTLTPIWLWIAGLGSGIWLLGSFRSMDRVRFAGAVALFLAIGMGSGFQQRLGQVADAWPSLRVEIEDRSAAAADEALNRLLDDGERAVAGAEAAVSEGGTAPAGAVLFENLEDLRHATGVAAIMLFAADGEPVAWAGEHRGSIPREVSAGSQSFVFHEGPLFSYLYFVRQLPEGQTAAAAFLLDGSVEAEQAIVAFADRFQRQHGPRPRFWVPDRAPPDAVWDWATDDRPIFSVSFVALSQQGWWQRIAADGRRWVGGITLTSLILLSLGWYRSGRRPAAVPLLVGTCCLLLAPLGAILGSGGLFSPLLFVLPGPADITLAALLVLVTGASIWLLSWRSDPDERIPIALSGPLLGLVFLAGIGLISVSASDTLLASRPGGGLALQLAAAVLIALPTYQVLSRTRSPAMPVPGKALVGALGYLLPAGLALMTAGAFDPDRSVPLILATAWAIPGVFLVLGRVGNESPAPLRLWLTSGWLAGTLVLAFLWPLHVRAELQRAEREIGALGTRSDPYLDYLLRQFADRAQSLDLDGQGGVNLLYRSWAESGLAREGYEARLSLWQVGAVETELNLSELASLPPRVTTDVLEGSSIPNVLHYGGSDGLHYLLVAPLSEGRQVSVAVPPRRRLAAATPLARFLYPDPQTGAASRGQSLYLVPFDAEEAAAHVDFPIARDTVHWVRTVGGWRSETLVEMPEGSVHAHLVVEMPPAALLLTRAILVQVAILALMMGIWFLGRLLGRDPSALPIDKLRLFRSFRGRLSVALFVFFLLPTLVFGAVSYEAVAREVIRSAAALAQQTLDQAASRLPDTPLSALGGTVQTDLLLYRQGTIVTATAPEVIELGLFHTWLPAEVFLSFAGGEAIIELEERRLASSDYLVAYRRLDTSTVLAAPIPLASNEIRRRQQEFRDVALLVVLLGLGLSVFLALLVSRALSSPLDQLRRAAVTVGSGNLRTTLPETRSDEFGNVYTSFNRMVSGLRSTRAALVKETRRTETIVAEAATGVLALDREGRIELINPRAAGVLGNDCRIGDLLDPDGEASGPVAVEILRLMNDQAVESGTEVEDGDRIIRIKLRRLAGENGSGGVVVALEDVTAEVRTARVLAWGEMARQVAHEIKNPLTPIKLSVQHLRRAFIDERPDFGVILDRNVDAILREIDRLSEISKAFSRFGTPSTGESPLEEVDVRQVIDEILALYQGAAGGVVFTARSTPNDPLIAVARVDELKEVLVNLLENAREAILDEGVVEVSVEPASDAESLRLLVIDSGVGIPENQLPRIFDPHFSTRSSGTGLGLAIVRRIVESWGGRITAASTPGTGTRIEVVLRAAGGSSA